MALREQEARNVEHAQQQLTEERHLALEALKQQHATIVARLQEELENIRTTGAAGRVNPLVLTGCAEGVQLGRQLADQKRALQADHQFEQRQALDGLEVTLKQKHDRELEAIRAKMTSQHQHELDAFKSKELANQRRLLEVRLLTVAAFLMSAGQVSAREDTRPRGSAAGSDAAEEQGAGKTQGGPARRRAIALTGVQEALSQKHSRTLESKSAKARSLALVWRSFQQDAEDERKKAEREAARDKAATVERLTAEFKAEKQKELELLRERYDRKYNIEYGSHSSIAHSSGQSVRQTPSRRSCTTRAPSSTSCAATTSTAPRSAASQSHGCSSHPGWTSRARRPAGRRCLCSATTFGTCRTTSSWRSSRWTTVRCIRPRLAGDLLPAVTLDSSAAYRDLGLLASALAVQPINLAMLPQASAECSGAPEVTTDVLFACAEELLAYLNAALQQVRRWIVVPRGAHCPQLDALRLQVHRDKILLKKQVEDELRLEHQAELELLRVGAHKA